MTQIYTTLHQFVQYISAIIICRGINDRLYQTNMGNIGIGLDSIRNKSMYGSNYGLSYVPRNINMASLAVCVFCGTYFICALHCFRYIIRHKDDVIHWCKIVPHGFYRCIWNLLLFSRNRRYYPQLAVLDSRNKPVVQSIALHTPKGE